MSPTARVLSAMRVALPLFALRELPLVARDVYRQQLWDYAREVSDTGKPKVVLVIGEAGTGLVSNASVGLAARLGSFAFSAYGILSAGGVTNVDLLNFALGDEGLDGAIGPGNDRSGQLSPEGQAFADNLAGAGLGTQNQVEEIIFQAEQAGVPVSDPDVQNNLEQIL